MKENVRNICFLLSYAWKKNKNCFVSTILKNMFSALIPLFGVVGLGAVVDAVEKQENVRSIIFKYVLYSFAISMISELLSFWDNVAARKMSNIIQIDYMKDSINIDYHYAQNGSILDLRKKSMRAHPVWFLTDIGIVFGFLLQFFGVMYVFARFSPFFIILIIVLACGFVFIASKNQQNDFIYQNEIIEDTRKIEYLYNSVTNYEYAKEIRINQADNYILKKMADVLSHRMNRVNLFLKKKLHLNLFETVLTVLETATMYFYFSFMLYKGIIGVSEYTILLGATSLLFGIIIGFFNQCAKIKKTLKYTELFRHYDEYCCQHVTIIKHIEQGVEKNEGFRFESLKFENVSFMYPDSDKTVLKNVTFEIKNNQKIGIVGLNGSGKTTLLNLLSRLYDPTEGRILLNNIDIKNIPYELYSQYFGIVLQNFALFAYPVWENITFNSNYDNNRLTESALRAGILETIKNNKKGFDTVVSKTFDADGVEFSGGEAQKIALARSLYKKAAILILDEPTSAMDPLAEYDFFMKLNDNLFGKTAIFISHRLSSTVFCDRIFVIENGTLVEQGTHSQLMVKKGLYYSLFIMQAEQYLNVKDGIQNEKDKNA